VSCLTFAFIRLISRGESVHPERVIEDNITLS